MIAKEPQKTYKFGDAMPPIPGTVASWPWRGSPALTKWSIDMLRYPLGTIITDVVDGHPVIAQIQTHSWFGAHPDWPSKPHKGTSVFVPTTVDATGKKVAIADPPDGWGEEPSTVAGVGSITEGHQMHTVFRNGRPLSAGAFGVGENFCPTLPYNCPPRPWEPDPGPRASIADRLGTGAPATSVGTGLACCPREWKPDGGQTLGVSDTAMTDTLLPNASLTTGQVLVSKDGGTQLLVRGGVTLHRQGEQHGGLLLSSFALGRDLVMQQDGNLVLLDAAGRAVWSTSTNGHPGASLVVQNDGNAVIYAPSGRPIWSSSKIHKQSGFNRSMDRFAKGAFKATASLVPGGGYAQNIVNKAEAAQAKAQISASTAASSAATAAGTTLDPSQTIGVVAVYGPYPQTTGTTAGVGNLDHGGHGGGGGHGGHGGGGHGGWHGGGGRFRGRGWGGGWGGRGGWGWGWGGPWWPYVVAAPSEVSCANWGDPINFPAALLPAARTTLINAGGDPVAVRGADGGLYLLSLDAGVPIGGSPGRLVTVRPCVGMVGIGNADDDVLRAMALDLLGSLRRTGAPQYATRSVKNFAQAWNTASADAQIATDGKYTGEIEGALNAALAALSPSSGTAPAAVL